MRLLIDTDAGVDDAQAILMALTHPGVTVEAITTVTGNVHVDHVLRNVCTVLDLAGGEAAIYRGADHPLVPGFWQPEERVHGADGLGNLAHRPPTRRTIEPEPAAVALIRLADEAPGEYTLVMLGPMTNVALACKLDPTFPDKIKQLVFMGGTVAAMGNTKSPTAEFNLFCDPEAALIVLTAFPQAVMLSWETTLRHPFSWNQYDALAALDTPAGRFFRDITRESVQLFRRYPNVPGFLLPDPLAMAVALEPSLVQHSEQHAISVEINGRYTRGQTVIDYFGQWGRTPNVTVISAVDIEGVYELYQRMLS